MEPRERPRETKSLVHNLKAGLSTKMLLAIHRASSLVRPAWRLSPFPLAGLPVIAGHTTLNHFIPPVIARHDQGSEVAAAEAKRAKRNHNENLQQLAHRPSPYALPTSPDSLAMLAAILRPHPC